MPFSLKVPLYAHVWSECIPCFGVKKKRTLLGEESSFLLGYPDSNQERQDQNLQCYHYTIAQSICFAKGAHVLYALFLVCECKGKAFF